MSKEITNQLESQAEEGLMTREEAAKFLSVNLVTFWRYCRDKKFPYYRCGRKMFFRKSEIMNAIRVN
jgi:excisionase family DNA binding protein